MRRSSYRTCAFAASNQTRRERTIGIEKKKKRKGPVKKKKRLPNHDSLFLSFSFDSSSHSSHSQSFCHSEYRPLPRLSTLAISGPITTPGVVDFLQHSQICSFLSSSTFHPRQRPRTTSTLHSTSRLSFSSLLRRCDKGSQVTRCEHNGREYRQPLPAAGRARPYVSSFFLMMAVD